MTDTPYLGETTDLILGEEFLTWLWFKSSTGSIFNDRNGRPFTVSMERRIVVQGGEGDNLETASVSGIESEFREARLGLANGKKVTRALVRLERDPESWQLTIRANDFCLSSLRTPKVEKEEDDDPDAVLLEKISLVDECIELIDILFERFVEKRVSPEWQEEVSTIRQWVKK